MDGCWKCHDFLKCFAEEKNKQARFNPWVKNGEVVKHMRPCENFKSVEKNTKSE